MVANLHDPVKKARNTEIQVGRWNSITQVKVPLGLLLHDW